MIIRDATAADAVKACEAIRASIAELCVADHNRNPEILRRWLASKTPDNVAAWMASVGSSLLVAVEGETILAVGGSRTTARSRSTTSRHKRAFAVSAQHF